MLNFVVLLVVYKDLFFKSLNAIYLKIIIYPKGGYSIILFAGYTLVKRVN